MPSIDPSTIVVSSDPLAAFNAAQSPANNSWVDSTISSDGSAFNYLIAAGGMPAVNMPGAATSTNTASVTSNMGLWLAIGAAVFLVGMLIPAGGRRR